MINFGQVAIGLILVLVVVGGLLYVFYSRTNAVEKTGYGALAMLGIVALMIPIFWIAEGGYSQNALAAQEATAVNRGMILYATDCTMNCYGIQKGQGTQADKVVNPTYNGYSFDAFKQMTDYDLNRIVSAGEYNPTVTAPNSNQIVRSDQYGGQLNANDINYLVAFIRSTDPSYLSKNNLGGTVNGLTLLPDYLQTNLPKQYDAAVSLSQAGQFGLAKDVTKQKAVTIDIVGPQAGETCTPSCYQYLNIKVKVGTVITWVNTTSLAHSVTAIQGKNTAAHDAAPQIFDSGGTSKPINTNQKFTYKVTEAAYTFNPDHTVIYYCVFHPDMLAELTIVK